MGLLEKALALAERQGARLTKNSAYCLLQRCEKRKDVQDGVKIQYLLRLNGLDSVSVLNDHLIRILSHNERWIEANQAFCKINKPSWYSWAAILCANAEMSVFDLHYHMQFSDMKSDRCTYVAILKACKSKAFSQGKIIHSGIINSRLLPDLALDSLLIDMYSKCGGLKEARIVFDNLSSRDVITWNAMIVGYIKHGEACLALSCFEKMREEGIRPNVVSWGAIIAGYAHVGDEILAVEYFDKMVQDGIEPQETTYCSVLKACSSLGLLDKGRLLHMQIVETGLLSDLVLGNILVDMYAKGGDLEDASRTFEELSNHDVVSWNTIIAGYAQHGLSFLALESFQKLHQSSIKPNGVTFLNILKACANAREIVQGRLVHDEVINCGFELDIVIGSSLSDMYVKCGSMKEALKVFNGMPKRNVVTWNTIIAGHIQHGEDVLALECLQKMQEESIEPNVVSWSTIIAGYLQHGQGTLALECFENMQKEYVKPNIATLISVIKACTITGEIERGRIIHHTIAQTGVPVDGSVGSALIEMYAKCGSLSDACMVFDGLLSHDVISWSTMTEGCAQQGDGSLSLEFFSNIQKRGIKPDRVIFFSVLKVCANLRAIAQGRLLHENMISLGIHLDITIGNTLIDMYAKCDSLMESYRVFDLLQNPGVISWNALITGCAQNDDGLMVLDCFTEMIEDGMKPGKIAFVNALKGYTCKGARVAGRLIHDMILESELQSDVIVGSSLVDMYVKCGSIEEARNAFDKLQHRDVISWGAIIAGYAYHGDGLLAVQHFEKMQEEGIKPNDVLFTNILIACSRSDLIEEGYWYYKSMKNFDHVPNSSHYICMIDLLCRAGFLHEGEDLIRSFNRTDIMGWTSLLSACRVHGKVELGESCFNQICSLNDHYAPAYVLMSNLYADAHKNEERILNRVYC